MQKSREKTKMGDRGIERETEKVKKEEKNLKDESERARS